MLGPLDAHIGNIPFLFGCRPSAADSGLCGQRTWLATFDPTPSWPVTETGPRVLAWVQTTDGLSGLDPTEEDRIDRDPLRPTLKPVLAEVGRTYAPVLLANARSIEAGADEATAEIDGRPCVQRRFSYHAKCLQWNEYAGLDGTGRDAVDGLLAHTGRETLF